MSVQLALADFQAAYAAYSVQYAQALNDALISGVAFNQSYWLTQRDDIVQNAHDQLRKQLSAASVARFESYIASRKVRMRIVPSPDMSQASHSAHSQE